MARRSLLGDSSVLVKTDAIALKVYPVMNTSRVVVWLTKDHGRVATVIKGACRPKSMFLGQFDSFQTCELVFYEREGGGDSVRIAREACTKERRDELRGDWRGSLSASYAAGLVDAISEHAMPSEELYMALTDLLDRIVRDGASERLLLWFEMRLLKTAGLAPDWNGCGRCRANGGGVMFSIADGRAICRECRGTDALRQSGGWVSVSAATADALDGIAEMARPDLKPLQGLTADDAAAARRFVGLFMRRHLDIPLDSRAVAYSPFARA